ncbi:MAG: glycosyltransferase [Gammaproteobacteria bacterium]|nr:glycosyltransferase [Gammaproteobacteria bacterium]
MPAYNHEKFVGAAIESVLNQTLDDLELVVIDDGSTDRTANVVTSFSDPRLRYFYQDNQDAYNTINRGLRLATGGFISILNSDDIYELGRLERLRAIHEETSAHCIFTDVTPIDDQGQILDTSHGWHGWHQRNRDVYFRHDDLYIGFLHGNFMVTTSNIFMTRAAVRKVGEFAPLRYLHDYDYIFRVLLAYPNDTIYVHDQRLLSYRIHGSNTLSEAAIVGREQDKAIIRKYLLARCPQAMQALITTGIDRLIALEHELTEVRRQQADDSQARQQSVTLSSRLRRKLKGLMD